MVGVLEGSLEQVRHCRMNRDGANSVAVTPSFIASSTPCALVAIAQCPDPLDARRKPRSDQSEIVGIATPARSEETQLQSAINLRCNLTTSPLGNYGDCGDLHISYDEIAERDMRDAGPEFVVDHDLAARVDRDARRVELEIVRVWPAADRDEHVRAKVTLIGKSGRTKGVPRTSLCSSARRVRRCRDVVRCQMPRLRAPS
jgi:hypothetical protein